MSVPLFFMISGFLLLGKVEPIKIFLKKRMKKIIIPLMVWSVIYILWHAYYSNSSVINLKSFYSVLFTPASYHLWFLYALIGLYLYMPVLRIFVVNSNKTYIYYFIILWFLVSLIPYIQGVTDIKNEIDLRMMSGFIGYLVLGSFLGKIIIRKNCHHSVL